MSQPASLMTLPAEIRQKIYGYAVKHESIHVIHLDLQLNYVFGEDMISKMITHNSYAILKLLLGRRMRENWKRRCLISILLISRQVYREAIDLFYSTNPFYFHHSSTFTSFITMVPPQNWGCIRSLTIRYSSVCPEPPTELVESQNRYYRELFPRDWKQQWKIQDWNQMWVILAKFKQLLHLEVQVEEVIQYHGHGYTISPRVTEELMFRAAWDIKLARKWQLCLGWNRTVDANGGADFTGAPFEVDRSFNKAKCPWI